MRVLVLGSGAREHALVWKIAQSPLVEKIYAIPGSDAISRLAEKVDLGADSIEELAEWAKNNQIDLTVVGPEVYLALGITDAFQKRGLTVFGPSKAAARLEASKIFAKEIMSKYKVPTAPYRVFSDPDQAIAYVKSRREPLVVKADGLAGGKGVTVADTPEEAEEAIIKLMIEKIFGDAGQQVVIEEKLSGEEVSLLAVTDGETVLPLLPAQDHKRVFAGDRGPNTGGMGAYAPASILTPSLLTRVQKEILEPVIRGMAAEGHPYRGILYAGLMITDHGPQVVEFNVRFGDPEAQVILPLLESDLVQLMLDTIHKRLDNTTLKWANSYAACVVLASAGYPEAYKVGKVITGLEEAEALSHILVFHAGTELDGNTWKTAGGRVLNVVGLGSDLPAALQETYRAVRLINFPGCHYRKDIGWRELARLR